MIQTGIQIIDEQHAAIESAAQQARLGLRFDDETVLVNMLGQLVLAMVDHYSYETKLMRDVGYPDALEHIRDHDRLLARMRRFLAQVRAEPGLFEHLTRRFTYKARNQRMRQEILAILDSWVETHVHTYDVQFSDWARREKIGF